MGLSKLRPELGRLTRAHALLLAAMLVGGGLRFANLGGVPPALDQDEAVTGYDAYSLFLTGRDHHGHPFPTVATEAFGDWPPPLLTYLMIPAVGLFGPRIEVLRAVSALMGVLAIPLVAALGRELFGRPLIGLLAGWLIAISPLDVHVSRWAVLPSTVPTMLALSMFLLVWSVHRLSNRGVVAVAVAAGLTVASYHTMKLYVPLLGLAALLIYRRSLLRLRREALLYAAVAFSLIVGPMLYFTLRDPGGGARLAQVTAFRARGVGPASLTRQYLTYLSPQFLFAAGDRDPMHSPPGFGIELRTAAPLLVAGLIWLAYAAVRPPTPPARRSALFLLAALALYPVPGALTRPSPYTPRVAQAIPLLALLGAAGAVALADQARCALRNARPAVARTAFALLLFGAGAAMGSELLARYRDYFADYPGKVARQFQYGLEQALGYARAHEAEYSEIWVTDTNEPYIYVLFYAGWPPSDVHRSLEVRREPLSFNRVDGIGKYRFTDPPRAWRQELPVLYTVPGLDGGVAYQVRGGETGDGKRVLLVHRPP